MDQLVSWTSENAMAIGLSTIIALCLGAVAFAVVWDRRASIRKYLEHRREVRIQRGLLMGKKKKAERQSFLKQLLADVVTDGFEEAWLRGKVTREEANNIYRAIGKTHGIPDLLPHMTPAQLKSAIKGRRARGLPSPAQEKPAWGEDPPAADDQPQSAAANVINATKRFGEKALGRLKKTG